MPPLPPVPQVVRIKVTGTTQGQPWFNGFYLKYSGTPPDSAALNGLCASIGTAWAASLSTVMHTSASVTNITAVDLTSSTSAEGVDSSTHAGTVVTGNPNDVSTAVVISWPVNRRWRGGHARTYLTGTINSDIQGGRQWTAAFQGQVATAATTFRNSLNALSQQGAPWSMVLVSYQGKDTTVSYPFVIATNAPAVHPRIDNQRRRLGKEF